MMKIVFGAKLELWPEDARDELYLRSHLGVIHSGDEIVLQMIPLKKKLTEKDKKSSETYPNFYLVSK